MSEKVVSIFGVPGEFRDGVEVLVKAIPEVRRVICFDRIPDRSERNLVIDIDPDLIIIDLFQPDKSCRSRLGQLKRSLPLVRILALVKDEKQGELLREADEVLVLGFRGDRFVNTVKKMIK